MRNTKKKIVIKINIFYRSEPSKFQSIVGWLVMESDNPNDDLSFQLTDPVRKNVYKMRAPTPELAQAWVSVLSHGVRGGRQEALPANLISFE